MDFSKAFDRINFNLLLSKLKSPGFSVSTMSWNNSYLRGRIQCVKVMNHVSGPFHTFSGGSQGAHSSQLHFNIFVNDINDVVSERYLVLIAEVYCKQILTLCGSGS